MNRKFDWPTLVISLIIVLTLVISTTLVTFSVDARQKFSDDYLLAAEAATTGTVSADGRTWQFTDCLLFMSGDAVAMFSRGFWDYFKEVGITIGRGIMTIEYSQEGWEDSMHLELFYTLVNQVYPIYLGVVIFFLLLFLAIQIWYLRRRRRIVRNKKWLR